jgi:hypothetical protein
MSRSSGDNMAAQNKIARRSFFAAIGVVAATGIAAKIVPKIVASGPADSSEPAGDSYRLTEHVKKYYRTTTI